MIDIDAQKKHWEFMAEHYERFYGYDKPLHQRKIKRKAELMIAFGRITEKANVLELGCGTGAYTSHFMETGANITAVDLSAAMIDVARSKKLKADFIQMDCHSLDRFSNLDAVVGAYVLQYLDLKVVVPEIRKALKHGGRVCFIEPNVVNPIVFFFTRLKMTRFFGRPSLSKSFLRHGFHWNGFDLRVWPIEPRSIENIPLLKEWCGSLVIEGYKT
jgi:SAM-dependent methyltransferase